MTVALTSAPEERAEEIIVIVFKGVVGEEIGKDIVGLTEVEVVEVASSARHIEAVLVVDSAFFGVGEVLVGFCDFSKLLDCLFFVIRVLIGMPLDSQLLVGFLYFSFCRTLAQSQHFVVIALCLRHQSN